MFPFGIVTKTLNVCATVGTVGENVRFALVIVLFRPAATDTSGAADEKAMFPFGIVRNWSAVVSTTGAVGEKARSRAGGRITDHVTSEGANVEKARSRAGGRIVSSRVIVGAADENAALPGGDRDEQIQPSCRRAGPSRRRQSSLAPG